jgi:outer membrane biosynthesis protein TonB
MRTERAWWLGGFLLLSILIHLLLARYGPGGGPRGIAPTPGQIELTLEPLPPAKKPHPPQPRARVAARPQPRVQPRMIKEAKAPKPVRVAEKRPPAPKVAPQPVPKVAVNPIEDKPVVRPVAQPSKIVTPEAPTEPTQPVKAASVTPYFRPRHSLLPMVNPLAGLTATEDRPQATAARADAPRLTRAASARMGLAGGASGGGHGAARGPQTPTELPTQDIGLSGGMHFPRMASRLGGQSILSVNNPLAEDAVPEEKPGFSSGVGWHPGIGAGGGRGGLNGLRVASRLGGNGSGFGGGTSGGRGAGSGKGSGSGRGSGRGTGAGRSGSGDGNGADVPGGGADGYGGTGFGMGGGRGGSGMGGGLRVAARTGAGGGAFGGVGDLLRGDPPRTPGDGRAGRRGHGLTAQIFEGTPYLTNQTHQRTDAFIDFNWGTSAAIIYGASRLFSVRWTGQIEAPRSDTYTFVTLEDDGLRVWIDGQPVIDDWHDHKPAGRRGAVRLDAGRRYDIKVEYFENGIGHAEVHLRWTSPRQPLEVVPESALWQAKP